MSEPQFPQHNGGLIIFHNQHKAYYKSAEVYLMNDLYRDADQTTKDRMIELDSIWECQWYPETPIGFHVIVAPTWNELVEAMCAEASESQRTTPE